jgi:manganese/zinc/iron transport system permease protein
MLAVHLLHHERTAEAERECRVDHLQDHLQWTPAFAERAIQQAERTGTVRRTADRLALTDAGRQYAQDSMVE